MKITVAPPLAENRQPDYGRRLLIAAGLCGLLLMLTVFISQLTRVRTGDVALYQNYAYYTTHGQLPYRTLHLEYPPGVLPFLLLPLLFGGTYFTRYVTLAFIALLLIITSAYRLVGLRKLLFALLPLVPLVEFTFYQLDIFAALALYGAVACFQQKRYGWSGVLLAASTLIKASPIICLAGLFWLVPRGKRRPYLTGLLLTLLVVLVPLLIWAPQGMLDSFLYHSGRPIEFEASAAAVGYVLHGFGASVRIFTSHASMALWFPGQALASTLSSFLLLVSTAFVGLRGARGHLQSKPASLAIALLLIFILFFKVASPQYLVVPVLLLPLARAELGHVWRGLVLRLFGISFIAWLQFVALFQPHPLQRFSILVTAASLLRLVLLVETTVFLLRRIRKLKATNDMQAA